MPETEKYLSKGSMYLLMFEICTMLILGSILFSPPDTLLNNFLNLQVHRQSMFTDAMAIAGRNGALLNAALIGMCSMGIILLARVRFSMITLSLFFINVGFGFTGLTVFACIPILIGSWIYSKSIGERFQTYANETLLAFSIAPFVKEIVVSEFAGNGMPEGIVAAFFCGIFIGFVVPPVTNYFKKLLPALPLHAGITAVSLVAAICVSLYTSILVNGYMSIRSGKTWNHASNDFFWIFFGIIFIVCITIGFLGNGKSLKNYYNYLIQKFKENRTIPKTKYGNTLINIGLVGVIGMIYIAINSLNFHGMMVSYLFCFISWAALGANPLNIIIAGCGFLLANIYIDIPLSQIEMMAIFAFLPAVAVVSKMYPLFITFIAAIAYTFIAHFIYPYFSAYNLLAVGFAACLTVYLINGIYNIFVKRTN